MKLGVDCKMAADNLITATAAVERYGAKPSDLKGLSVAKTYYSKKYHRDVALLAVEVVEAALVVRYGSLEACMAARLDRQAKLGTRGKKLAAANAAKRLSLPAGWPVVGSIKGASRWAAVDTETTGLSAAAGHRVVAVAVVIVDCGQVVTEWSTRINPGVATCWDWEAMEVNGITPEDVADAPVAATVWREFVELTAGMPLVCHNSYFDSMFIANELSLTGIEVPPSRYWCTMAAARRKRYHRCNLSTVYWKITHRQLAGAHGALADARGVAAIAPWLL